MADCFVPLRTIIVFGGLAFIALFVATRFYAKRARHRAEQSRRLIATAVIVFAIMGASYMRAFIQSCERQPACGVAWDLNCSRSQFFRASESAAYLISIGFAFLETARYRRERR